LQSDFVSKVSHELRTPLTSIRLFVETLQLKRVTSPGEVDACLDVLNRETRRLTARIERLLDWGRMESGYDQIAAIRTLCHIASAAWSCRSRVLLAGCPPRPC
jgi:signal transduction histidine kinase